MQHGLPMWSSGNSDMLQKMNGIREMQEKLTLKHFEIDQVRINQERYVALRDTCFSSYLCPTFIVTIIGVRGRRN